MKAMSQQLEAKEKENSTTLTKVSDTLWGIIEVKDLLVKVSQNVVNLQIAVSNSIFIRPIDPTIGAPATLEDPLGRLLPIPAEWLDTIDWEVGLSHDHLRRFMLLIMS